LAACVRDTAQKSSVAARCVDDHVDKFRYLVARRKRLKYVFHNGVQREIRGDATRVRRKKTWSTLIYDGKSAPDESC
jgi:hypothetical protein